MNGGRSNSNEWLFRALVRFGLDNIDALTDLANGNVNAYLKNNGKVLTSANADGKLVSYMLPGDRFSNPTTELMQVAEKALWFLTSYSLEEIQRYLKSYREWYSNDTGTRNAVIEAVYGYQVGNPRALVRLTDAAKSEGRKSRESAATEPAAA